MKKIKILTLLFFGLSSYSASAQMTNLPLTASQNNVYYGTNVQVTTTGSETGYYYYLRDNSNNSIVDGPIQGTGNNLVFNTGGMFANTSYNVFGSNEYALSFSYDYESINLSNTTRGIDTAVTVAAWIKTASSSGLRNIVTDYGANDAGYFLRTDANGRASISGRDGTNTYKNSGPSTTVVTDNQWHYVVGTVDVTTGVWSIYVDAVLENSTTNTAGVSLSNTDVLYIGKDFSTSNTFVGEVRDVTFWTTPLTLSEISTNMNTCLTGTEPNIVGHFPLNKGNGTSATDHSSIAINGNINTYSTPWVINNSTCRASLQMSQIINVTVSTGTMDLPVAATTNNVNYGGNTDIVTTGSQLGYTYTLRDGNNVVIDGPIAGTGNNLTFNTGAVNTSTTYNVYGTNEGAMNLTGYSDQISFTTSNRGISNKVSVSAWIKTGNSASIKNIVRDYGTSVSDAGFFLRIDASGKVYISGRDGSGTNKTSGSSTTVVTDNQWHYVVGTANAATGDWSIYVDGILENYANNGVGNSFANAYNLFIGSSFSTTDSYEGYIKNVTIWNKELSASDITLNMSYCTVGTENNVVGHFPLTDGIGTTVLDHSSIGINGTTGINANSGWVNPTSPVCGESLQMTQTATVNVVVLVSLITVQGQGGVSIITTSGGTLQMEATVLPANADDPTYNWTVVPGTGSANITASGVLTAVTDGTVTVEATANDGSGITGSKVITISNQPVGLNEVVLEKLNIYPNPVQNELFIELEGQQMTGIKILDLTGKVVMVKSGNVDYIDVSTLTKGVYVLKVSTEMGIATSRFVKQ